MSFFYFYLVALSFLVVLGSVQEAERGDSGFVYRSGSRLFYRDKAEAWRKCPAVLARGDVFKN